MLGHGRHRAEVCVVSWYRKKREFYEGLARKAKEKEGVV
jgi:hypothetical protein